MRHVELFSGVGGFRRAMDLISNDLGFEISTIAHSEIDPRAVATYTANFDTSEELDLGDIVEFTKNKERMNSLADYGLLSGGFPCQTFSVMGDLAGFGEHRGQMFFRIMDMVNCHKPRYVLLENVKNIVNHDGGNTIKVILSNLEENYCVHYDVFNTKNFGLPQRRSRMIMFARLKEYGDFDFTERAVIEAFEKIDRKKCSLDFYENLLGILEKKVHEKYYLSEKIKPTILSDGSANFKSNSDIDQFIARPLTATMHKMHRACQDNYFSDMFIDSDGKNRPSETMTKQELSSLRIRKLTPKEAFMLQGFPANFAEKAAQSKVSDGALYRQAGNAVSVNTIYAVMNYLITNHIIRQ